MKLAIQTGGAVAGLHYGGPRGAMLGWTAGGIIADSLGYGPKNKQEPNEIPSMDDLKITNSSYGIARPLLYGRTRASGNIIWSTPISQVVHAAGIGGIDIMDVDEEVTASFAVAFGETVGAAGAYLVRLRVNGEIVYGQNRPHGESNYGRSGTRPWGLGGAAGPQTAAGLGDFTWYPGTADQDADPTMQAALDLPGESRTPAFRGTCYMVCEDWDASNGLPNIEAEIINVPDDMLYAYISDLITSAEGSAFNTGEYASNKLAIDWRKRVAYLQVLVPTEDEAKTGFRVIDLNIPEATSDTAPTMPELEEFSVVMNDTDTDHPLHATGGMCVLPDGDLVFVAGDDGGGDASVPVMKLQGELMTAKGSFGENSGSSYGWQESGGNWYVDPLQFLVTLNKKQLWYQTALRSYIFGATNTSNKVAGVINAHDMTHLWSTDEDSYPLSGDEIKAICRGASNWFGCTGYIITGPTYTSPSSGSLYIYKITITGTGLTDTVTPSLIATLSPSDFKAGESTLVNGGHGLQYDDTDGTLLFAVELSSDSTYRVIKFDPDVPDVEWSTAALDGYPSETGTIGAARLVGTTYAFVDGTKIVKVNTDTGLDSFGGTVPTGADSDDVCIYDSQREMLYGPGAGTAGLVMWPVSQYVDPTVTADDVFSDICGRVGLEAADIDVSDINDLVVRGYGIGRMTSPRTIIDDIMRFYQLYCVESDDILKFLKHTDTVDLYLTESDLMEPTDGGNALTEVRRPDSELPLAFTINFVEWELGLQQGSQSVKRIEAPNSACYSHNQMGQRTNLSVAADTVRQQAEKILHTAWNERTAYSFGLSAEHLALDPGDVAQLTMDDGMVHKIRVTSVEVGNNLAMQIEGVSVAPAQYDSTVTSGAVDGSAASGIAEYPRLKIFVADMPLLDDEQETQDRVWANIQFFISRTREDDVEFNNATIWMQNDAGDWIRKATVTNEASWGRTSSVSGLYPPGYDLSGTLLPPETQTPLASYPNFEVKMVVGEPNDDCTAEECLNGVNRLVLIYPDGSSELIHYASATENGYEPKITWGLSHLYRGMRGSEIAAYNDYYDTNPSCVAIFLDPDVKPTTVRVPYEKIGTELKFRVSAYNQPLAEAETFSLVPLGRSMMPYHPRAEVGYRLANDGVLFKWQRRTRVGGRMEDEKHEAPMYEDFEGYELEIYYPDADTLVRRVDTALIGQTQYIYSAADQTEDSVPLTATSLWIKVFQLSAQVGRGFSRAVEVKLRHV